MKVKRYVADTMRAALDRVREEMGPDVLILGNRRTADGIEIMVADPADMAGAQEARRQPKAAAVSREEREAITAGAGDFDAPEPLRKSPARGLFEAILDDDDDAAPRLPRIEPARRAERVKQKPRVDTDDLWTHSDLIADMQSELRALKDLVEHQLAGFAWGAYGTEHPERALLLRHLVKLGVTPALAREVLDQVPGGLSRKVAWHRALGILAHRLVEYPEQMFEDGGVFLICGPSGVGKTSTIAKIAARRALAHGAERMTIISADNRRIGAHQQLKSIGRILGVSVVQAESVASIEAFTGLMEPGHLTLIDTAGCFSEVDQLAEELRVLEDRLSMPVMPLLVLAANMDTPTLERTVQAYASIEPAAVVVTKTDEADTTGAVLSTLAGHALPIAYVSSGPRVPDDLKPAVAHQMITDLATRRSMKSLDTQDLGLACERGFEHAVNWN